MLTVLAVLTIVALVTLILARLTSVLVALALVPVATALAGGFGRDIGSFALEGIRGVTPVAVLLAFAVVYFGVMNDAGLFEPLVRVVVRQVGRDPVRIAVGTAAIACLTHLDGAGASTFMVTVPAMLPIYRRAGMDPCVLTAVTALAAGTMNMLPWAGPVTRAASVLQASTSDIFVAVVPAMVVGLITVFVMAARLGRGERARLSRVETSHAGATGREASDSTVVPIAGVPSSEGSARDGGARSPSTPVWYFNAALTMVVLGALFTEVVPLPVVFIVASAVALLVNYPSAEEQRTRLLAHSTAAMLMVVTIFAAGVFSGVLTKSGMLASLSGDLVHALPGALLRHATLLVAVTSMPLSLAFDPDSFYFGLLPVLADAYQAAGGVRVDVARAAVLGQMTTGFPVSPLTPSTFLLVGLAGLDLAEHQRRTIPYAFVVTLVMTLVAWATGAIRL